MTAFTTATEEKEIIFLTQLHDYSNNYNITIKIISYVAISYIKISYYVILKKLLSFISVIFASNSKVQEITNLFWGKTAEFLLLPDIRYNMLLHTNVINV